MAANENIGTIYKVAGPLIVASGMRDVHLHDVVRVSEQKLIGEIIELRDDLASIQVYEDTSGIGPGEPVYLTGEQLVAELGPGLIEGIFDGIERPLNVIYQMEGDRIRRGSDVPKLSREKKWAFEATAAVGDEVGAGDIIGEVKETEAVTQRIMIPYGISGTITRISSGEFTVADTVATVKDAKGVEHEVTMMQKWPVRKRRQIGHV